MAMHCGDDVLIKMQLNKTLQCSIVYKSMVYSVQKKKKENRKRAHGLKNKKGTIN